MFKFYIDNFRSFKDQEFNFSKINILIGENNSGKSSLLKFFLALKQSIAFSPKSNFSLMDDLVDLGYYEDIVYNHDIEKLITFAFEFDNKYKDFFDSFMYPVESPDIDENKKKKYAEIKKLIDGIEDFKVRAEFILSKDLSANKEISSNFINSKLGELSIKANLETSRPIDPTDEPKCTISYRNDNINFESNIIEFEKKSFLSLIVGKSLKSELDVNKIDPDFYYKIAYLLVSQNYLDFLCSQITFFNPLDSKPERLYIKNDTSNYFKNDLNRFVNLLSEPDISQDVLARIFSEINSILNDFGIAEELLLVKDNKLPVKELRVKIKNIFSNIKDVGYGVALQIPLFFELILNKEYRKIFLIEQPEVHLFPKLQAKFIETLIKHSNDSNIFFIETHSEHIIRKLQVLIKESKYGLKPEDVSIHYLVRGDKKSNVTEHRIDNKGILSPIFPKGFFDTSYTLVKELLD